MWISTVKYNPLDGRYKEYDIIKASQFILDGLSIYKVRIPSRFQGGVLCAFHKDDNNLWMMYECEPEGDLGSSGEWAHPIIQSVKRRRGCR